MRVIRALFTMKIGRARRFLSADIRHGKVGGTGVPVHIAEVFIIRMSGDVRVSAFHTRKGRRH
jgi:hypothetical protein